MQESSINAQIAPAPTPTPAPAIGGPSQERRDGWDEVKPYKIHVSSKYLSLTQKKLELTRLPHELLLPKSRDWEYGTPKREIEPLIDFWLENYSWRNQEGGLNTIPQYRVALPLSEPGGASVRVHFLHIKSKHRHAIPLLLVPSFPLTNLSLEPLFKPLTDPSSPTSMQPFHLVVPSIPGLGFSDRYESPEAEKNVLKATAKLFDGLMGRLGYENYVASATGCGRDGMGGVNYYLAKMIGESFWERCLGIHLLEPVLEAPRLSKGALTWFKWKIAAFFQARIFGYEDEDWKGLEDGKEEKSVKKSVQRTENTEETPLAGRRQASGIMGLLGLRQPNTISYAICDSPVGLLSLVCSALRKLSPQHNFSYTQIINLTQLAWLPGPEAGMRFWSAAMREIQELKKQKSRRGRAAITVFGADGLGEEDYVCPTWAAAKHEVLYTQRVGGKPGLMVWERVDVIVKGIRGLVEGIERVDGRLKMMRLEGVVVDEEGDDVQAADNSNHGIQLEVESPDTVVAYDMS